MNDLTKATLVGDPVDVTGAPIEKPKSRAQKIADWRKAHEAEYKKACDANCTCTPTRAQMLMINQWDSPPVD
jgi:hypothetical protein